MPPPPGTPTCCLWSAGWHCLHQQHCHNPLGSAALVHPNSVCPCICLRDASREWSNPFLACGVVQWRCLSLATLAGPLVLSSCLLVNPLCLPCHILRRLHCCCGVAVVLLFARPAHSVIGRCWGVRLVRLLHAVVHACLSDFASPASLPSQGASGAIGCHHSAQECLHRALQGALAPFPLPRDERQVRPAFVAWRMVSHSTGGRSRCGPSCMRMIVGARRIVATPVH
jgi:hypothetical protein